MSKNICKFIIEKLDFKNLQNVRIIRHFIFKLIIQISLYYIENNLHCKNYHKFKFPKF